MSETPTPLIYEKMAAIEAEVGPIAKSRRNKQQGYAFRGIDDAYEALQQIMAKHGVFATPEVLPDSIRREERTAKSGSALFLTFCLIRYTFYAKDGSSVKAVTLGEGMDSGDKSANKAMAGAHKYALLQVFMVPTRDPKDSENENPDPAPRQQPGTNTGDERCVDCGAPSGKIHGTDCPRREK